MPHSRAPRLGVAGLPDMRQNLTQGTSALAASEPILIEPPAPATAGRRGPNRGVLVIASKLVIPVALLGVATAAGAGVLFWAHAPSTGSQWAVVEKYCFECHNE